MNSIEFRVRDMVSFIETKNRDSRLFPVFRVLDRLLLGPFLVTDEFLRIRRESGDCRIFVYA